MNKKVNPFIIFIFLIITWNKIIPQEFSWQNYTSTESIKSMLIDGDTLWIGEIGPASSLVKMNLNTNSLTFYNTITAGLPDNDFYSIAKEKNGVKWFGSAKGLLKYEADAWHTFNPMNSPLPDTMVTAILVDNMNNKWIGTFRGGSFGVGDLGGLAKFDGTVWTIYRMDNSMLPNNNITAIAMESSGTIWVGTVNGLLKINGDSWTVYDIFNSGLYSNTITCIAIDDEDKAWIGTTDGITKYDNGNWINYSLGPIGSYENSVHSIGYFMNKVFAGNNEGLHSYDGFSWRTYLTPIDHNVKAIETDQHGNIWFGTNLRLAELTSESNYDSLYQFNIGNSELSSNFVKQIAFDNFGAKWISSSYGFERFKDGKWTAYDDKNTSLMESDLGITTIAVEDSSNIWVGTIWGKLLHLAEEKIEIFDQSNSPLGIYSINSIIVDNYKSKWIGTGGNGIYVFSENAWTSYNSTNSELTNDFINYLIVNKLNDIYIATYEGIFIYCSNCDSPWSRLLPEPPGSLGNQIASVAIDSTGILWAGSYGAGLYRYDFAKSIWNNYHTNNSNIPDNNIYSIAIDKHDNKWLATGISPNQGGISRFDGNEFRNFNTSNSPLLYNIVSYIGIDKENNKWICTNGGGLTLLNDNLTGIDGDPPPVSIDFYLSNNYPNPFNPITRIDFRILVPGIVNLKVYNVLGKEVAQLVNEWKPAGSYSVNFNAGSLSSGIYFYTLQSSEKFSTRKMILLK